jgi:hypothetical protein
MNLESINYLKILELILKKFTQNNDKLRDDKNF